MNTLKTIQALAKIGKVFSKIIFVFCIVGLCGCLVGAVSLALGAESFKLGVGTFLQIQDTQNALLGARLSYYQAIYNLLVSQSDLELLLGNAPLSKYGVTTDNKYTK